MLYYEEMNEYDIAQHIEIFISNCQKRKNIDMNDFSSIKKYITKGTFYFISCNEFADFWSPHESEQILSSIMKFRDIFNRIFNKKYFDIESQKYYIEDILEYAILSRKNIYFF